ncbi:High-affinity branched-chain amino acid transport system permease protein LivH [Pelagimonas phthalicica]|uniref:High-affinity branched-chain amino acid transport system permease protein LivH n=1 Tax=Pelagimonas phthalicica TaxID=1037362 RepID=A0A238JAI9_9RHOB|nr:urea ABC transporter permease subunit UrtB [Pelagimonas phthalicica]TDS94081.1 amino acid/amide ABC transporter membrane protein 1 (HAAT family) [Pelagimonas phthalicica]SMX27393.1 High-affinity branched-chain amino acid transport system permease protein LivH [Pelagimonas phthalicica]
MLRALLTVLTLLCLPAAVLAQDLQPLLQENQAQIAKPSRKKVGPVLDALVGSGLPQAQEFLEKWQGKEVYQRQEDGLFFYAVKGDGGLVLTDIDSGETATIDAKAMKQIKPNGGVRKAIGEALVQFQLSSPDLTRRQEAVTALARNLDPAQLGALEASISGETDAALKARKEQLVTYLTARFGDTPETRIAAINTLSGDIRVETRAVLSQILTTKTLSTQSQPDANVAGTLSLPREEAYALLVETQDLPAPLTNDVIRKALEANIEGGKVAGVSAASLNTIAARNTAYDALAASGKAPARVSESDITQALATWTIYEVYEDPDPAVTAAAKAAQDAVNTKVAVSQTADLALDALSLTSIYFLAAIGLAITFGVMGVINMAHGEFIMMGAYTGYVVQLFIPNYTVSLIVALPLAFAVTFAAGVAMERLVIRWLYNRPLETLLATFGVSIALQQLAKNIFGTQARPLTSPGWLDGALVFNDVIQISYIRIAIFVLALLFLALLLFILKRTRLGLETRAVTQNPRMAASMGINPDRIKMLTFGLGSGIAGIAGVAIGLYAKVTSEMGSDYIVQSFMTVVVGGVGNIWGTLAGASMIGTLQKGIEWLNPSNTLAAQTYMILFIILFIQFRPKGIVALKGRAAGD